MMLKMIKLIMTGKIFLLPFNLCIYDSFIHNLHSICLIIVHSSCSFSQRLILPLFHPSYMIINSLFLIFANLISNSSMASVYLPFRKHIHLNFIKWFLAQSRQKSSNIFVPSSFRLPCLYSNQPENELWICNSISL